MNEMVIVKVDSIGGTELTILYVDLYMAASDDEPALLSRCNSLAGLTILISAAKECFDETQQRE